MHYRIESITICDGIPRHSLRIFKDGKYTTLTSSFSYDFIKELYCKFVGGIKETPNLEAL